MLVQTTIPEASIETLNKRVLGWLAGLDEVQLDTRLLTPEEHGFAGHLRTIIEDQRAWPTTALHDLIEPSRHPGAGDANIHQLPNTQARVVIDDVQDPDAPTAGQAGRE